MSEKIRPALTPEEWAMPINSLARKLGNGVSTWGTDVEGHEDNDTLYVDGDFSPEARLKLAVRWLHEAGLFTWEDVEDEIMELSAMQLRLRDLQERSQVQDIRKYHDPFDDPTHHLGLRVERKRARIAKLEALLPPRGA